MNNNLTIYENIKRLIVEYAVMLIKRSIFGDGKCLLEYW